MGNLGNDFARNVKSTYSIAPASITATTTGAEVDCRECPKVACVVVPIGVVSTADATNFFTFTVTQATESGGTFAAADSTQYDPVAPTGSTTAWDRIINATTEGTTVQRFNFQMKIGYPYLKVVATETLTASAVFGAHIEFEPARKSATGA